MVGEVFPRSTYEMWVADIPHRRATSLSVRLRSNLATRSFCPSSLLVGIPFDGPFSRAGWGRVGCRGNADPSRKENAPSQLCFLGLLLYKPSPEGLRTNITR